MVWEKIINSITDFFGGLTPLQKRRLALVGTAVFALFLTLAVILSLRTPKDDKTDDAQGLFLNVPIPADGIFLPEEPEFVPGVLLERDRREIWTEEDALEFWQNPLRDGEEQWREKIEAAIDEMLERVP